VLADGTYDVVVVGVEPAEAGGVSLELAIAGGEHRGEVVPVLHHDPPAEPLDLLGIPGTLTVAGGEPRLSLEP
jgi:hypothetical protein